MKIHLQAQPPAFRPDHLTALIDIGEDRPLYTRQTAMNHPAWPDLERRQQQDSCKATYLALGASALLYLPGQDAKFWDDDEKIRILAARAYDVACDRKAAALILILDGLEGAGAAPLAAEGIALRAYKFDKYKSPTGKETAPAVTFVCPAKGPDGQNVRKLVEERLALAR
jgi:hypothetical protein